MRRAICIVVNVSGDTGLGRADDAQCWFGCFLPKLLLSCAVMPEWENGGGEQWRRAGRELGPRPG